MCFKNWQSTKAMNKLIKHGLCQAHVWFEQCLKSVASDGLNDYRVNSNSFFNNIKYSLNPMCLNTIESTIVSDDNMNSIYSKNMESLHNEWKFSLPMGKQFESQWNNNDSNNNSISLESMKQYKYMTYNPYYTILLPVNGIVNGIVSSNYIDMVTLLCKDNAKNSKTDENGRNEKEEIDSENEMAGMSMKESKNKKRKYNNEGGMNMMMEPSNKRRKKMREKEKNKIVSVSKRKLKFNDDNKIRLKRRRYNNRMENFKKQITYIHSLNMDNDNDYDTLTKKA